VKGDSFFTLAKHYKVGSKAIAEANPGVDSTRLKLGQKLHIPAPKPSAGSPAPGGTGSALAPASNGGGDMVYTVKSQDTLTKIAKNNGTSIKAIRAANNLRTDQLKVGQKLKIPSKAPPPLEATAPSPSLPPGTPGLPEAVPTGLNPVTNR
jgi:LysM repeat protein